MIERGDGKSLARANSIVKIKRAACSCWILSGVEDRCNKV